MKKKQTCLLLPGVAALLLFVLWTVLVGHVDVAAIGPRGSSVGFSTFNGFVHRHIGVRMPLYTVTDWMGLLPLCFILGFAALGLVQWIRRKSIRRVDADILLLGVFYLAVLAVYLFFERVVVNYRPVLIDGCLEASYPSSTTMLALCVLPTAILVLRPRIRCAPLRRAVTCLLAAVTAFMVAGRLLSGVHWATDIIGGLLCSAGLVMLYAAAARRFPPRSCPAAPPAGTDPRCG